MAVHIDSIAGSNIPKVSEADFYDALRWGDLIFCSGRSAIGVGIEKLTNSPFSHVLMAWLPVEARQWLTIEATLDRGVHVGKLSDYVDSYDGDLVLARRAVLTEAEKFAELNAGFSVLEDGYDWKQEVTVVGHRLLKFLPIEKPKREYYCSGLMYTMSLATSHPLQKPGPNLPTPEDNWTDASVIPICGMRNPAQSREATQPELRVA